MKQCRQWHADACTGIEGASVLLFDLARCVVPSLAQSDCAAARCWLCQSHRFQCETLPHYKQPLNKIIYFQLEVALILVTVKSAGEIPHCIFLT